MRSTTLQCHALAADGLTLSGKSVTVKARHYVVSGGAINSPCAADALEGAGPERLARQTHLPASDRDLGRAVRADINGYAGAPQTIYSDHFMDTQPIDGPVGYKLEAPPLHPVLFSTTMAGFGAAHTATMKQFSRAQAMLALLRDGFNENSVGGNVQLRDDGYPVLDYPISDAIWDGVKRAMLTMAEIQFAAGAQIVYPTHESASGYTTWAAAKQAIEALPYQPTLTRVVSAHVMGGCPMSDDTRLGLVSSAGLYHGLSNLSVHDGSLFPTSIGANPQLSIYGITARLASGLAEKLTGKPAPSLNASA